MNSPWTVVIGTLFSISFCIMCGWVVRGTFDDKKYLEHEQQISKIIIEKDRQLKQSQLALSEAINKIRSSASVEQVKTVTKYQTVIKEVIKYVKENPSIDVDVPSKWVFGILNPAISNTTVPYNDDLARLVNKTPTIKISSIVSNDVDNYYNCNATMIQLSALIDEITDNVKEINR